MRPLARVLVAVLLVSDIGVAVRPSIERAWFVVTLATEEAPAALSTPLATARLVAGSASSRATTVATTASKPPRERFSAP